MITELFVFHPPFRDDIAVSRIDVDNNVNLGGQLGMEQVRLELVVTGRPAWLREYITHDKWIPVVVNGSHCGIKLVSGSYDRRYGETLQGILVLTPNRENS